MSIHANMLSSFVLTLSELNTFALIQTFVQIYVYMKLFANLAIREQVKKHYFRYNGRVILDNAF